MAFMNEMNEIERAKRKGCREKDEKVYLLFEIKLKPRFYAAEL